MSANIWLNEYLFCLENIIVFSFFLQTSLCIFVDKQKPYMKQYLDLLKRIA